jgi:hypothetical protein
VETIWEYLRRIWEMHVGRAYGPLSIRLIIQPMVAAGLAIRAGLKDARAGRPAYGWAAFTDPVRRHELLREGWKHVAKLFVTAAIVDTIYQLIVFRWIYPGQALIVATMVAVPSYLLLRGPTNRLVRRCHQMRGGPQVMPAGGIGAVHPERKEHS